jgi:O-antigen biosynthesis protein WbqP
MYKCFLKRVSDIMMSFVAITLLLVPMAFIAVAIKIDSKGPVFFKQKRIGKNKKTFYILKFRTMRTDAPKDAPTHTLKDPTKWITKIGAFLRKTSLDELPQIFNIFVGQMSVVGPRPALWNQDDLIAERDKYGANGIRPGLTGWAQINGRDELPIPVKAKLDGEYVQKLSSGFFKGIFIDARCLFGTVFSVLRSEGVVEGATEDKAEEKTEETV